MRLLASILWLLALTATVHAVPRHLEPTVKARTVNGKPGARITVPLLSNSSIFTRAACGLFCVSKLAFNSTEQRKVIDDAAKAQSGQHAVPSPNRPVAITFDVAYEDHGLVRGHKARLVSTWPTQGDAAFHVFGQNGGSDLTLP